MAAINFPPNDSPSTARALYDINNPWTDPVNGGEWWFSPTKVRWLPVPAGGGASVSDTAYDATSWNGVTDEAPSKNAVRDKFESLPTVVDAVTDGSANAVSSNAVFDALALKAPLASPVFTGTVTAANADSGTGAEIYSNSGTGAYISSNSGTGAYISGEASGTGAEIYSDSGTGAYISSTSGTGAEISSNSGTYHATFGNTGIEQSFVARLKGAFGWIRGAFTGRIHPPDTLTGDRTWELPDASGTLALTSDINTLAKLDTIVTDATLARTDAGQTFAGAQAFSSTTRPTSAGTGTPAATSLITRADAESTIVDFDYATTTAVGATGGSGSWTWTPPATAKLIRVTLVSSGAGGGSGRCGAAGSDRSGGGGGASGTLTVVTVPASEFSGALTITVPAGGAGGAEQNTSDTNGNNGVIGGDALIASGATVLARASHPTANARGQGGGTTSGTAGTASTTYGLFAAQAGGAGSNSNGASKSGASTCEGGGGGGGCTAANAIGRGGTNIAVIAGMIYGGAPIGSNATSGLDGGVGTVAATTSRIPCGSGGVGGNGGYTVRGGAGMAGVRGGGGGGGGAGTNGTGSGAGGAGGDGFIRIECEF